MLKNLAFLFWAKNGQKSGSKFKKMAQKNQIGENGGERKINPSANPGDDSLESQQDIGFGWEIGRFYFNEAPLSTGGKISTRNYEWNLIYKGQVILPKALVL